MPHHMREDEVAKVDIYIYIYILQKKAFEAQKIVEKLQRGRYSARDCGPSKSAVYRFLDGATYVRDRKERRGRKRQMPTGVVTIAGSPRRSQTTIRSQSDLHSDHSPIICFTSNLKFSTGKEFPFQICNFFFGWLKRNGNKTYDRTVIGL